MASVEAREAALEIIAVITGKRDGQPPSHINRLHTLHSIAAGESTFAAIDLAFVIADIVQQAITVNTNGNVIEVAKAHGWDGQTYLSAWINRRLEDLAAR